MSTEHPNIHITDVTTYLACRTKWDWSSPLRRNLTSKEPNRHMWLGRMVHYALASYYGTPGSSARPREYLRSAYTTEALRSLAQIKTQLGHLPEALREFAVLGLAVTEHYGLWSPQHDTFDVVMPEVPLKVATDTYDFAGQTDGLIRDEHGGLWLLETKTAGRIPPEPLVGMTWQGPAYVWAARQDPALTRIGQIKGIMYNFLLKTPPTKPSRLLSGGLAKRSNLRSTPEAYMEQVRAQGLDPDDYAEYASRLPQDLFFRRFLVQYTDTQLKIFERNLGAVVSEIQSDPFIYPQDGLRACAGCEFVELCRARFSGQPYDDLLGDFVKNSYYDED